MDTSLDLNLLRVFEILLEEESATRAAIRLDLTQAAVSASRIDSSMLDSSSRERCAVAGR